MGDAVAGAARATGAIVAASATASAGSRRFNMRGLLGCGEWAGSPEGLAAAVFPLCCRDGNASADG
ncbi:hypothetical protein GCM10023196_064810 [Actinoallomurus vinaceus]|uniref:Uncharacterized protein n=1 Tax=Actinoallomurus vinaceus TaxID=1080074 RepID=A0ABP8UHN9_9ACTN